VPAIRRQGQQASGYRKVVGMYRRDVSPHLVAAGSLPLEGCLVSAARLSVLLVSGSTIRPRVDGAACRIAAPPYAERCHFAAAHASLKNIDLCLFWERWTLVISYQS